MSANAIAPSVLISGYHSQTSGIVASPPQFNRLPQILKQPGAPMLPDEPVYPQVYPATFTDAFGTEETVIVNHGPDHPGGIYEMTLRGVKFRAERLESWWFGNAAPQEARSRFRLRNGWLNDFHLRTMTMIGYRNAEGHTQEVPLYIEIRFPAANEWEDVEMALTVEDRWYYCVEPCSFINCLLHLKSRLSPGSELVTCELCRLSGLANWAHACFREFREWVIDPTEAEQSELDRLQVLHPERQVHLVPPTHCCGSFVPRYAPARDSRN